MCTVPSVPNWPKQCKKTKPHVANSSKLRGKDGTKQRCARHRLWICKLCVRLMAIGGGAV
eukprot:1292620-Amphidinium_carterae.2